MSTMLTAIRQLYKPIQPTVSPSAVCVHYHEVPPAPALQDYLYCYWQLTTTQPLTESFVYRVIADGCIDVFFELDNPRESFVMGFSKTFTEFPLGHTFHYVGIRFLPTHFPQLFGIRAAELTDRVETLTNVVPDLAVFIADHFTSDDTTEAIQQRLDAYFLTRLARTSLTPDPRLYNALHLILSQAGALRVETDLDTGLSPRQLRRLFTFYVGDTAKTFSQVVRFQSILHPQPSLQQLRTDKVFFDLGYYDQAHFIKEFRHFYGLTPGKAFTR
jgi:AraC-like DNA-binding protein